MFRENIVDYSFILIRDDIALKGKNIGSCRRGMVKNILLLKYIDINPIRKQIHSMSVNTKISLEEGN